MPDRRDRRRARLRCGRARTFRQLRTDQEAFWLFTTFRRAGSEAAFRQSLRRDRQSGSQATPAVRFHRPLRRSRVELRRERGPHRPLRHEYRVNSPPAPISRAGSRRTFPIRGTDGLPPGGRAWRRRDPEEGSRGGALPSPQKMGSHRAASGRYRARLQQHARRDHVVSERLRAVAPSPRSTSSATSSCAHRSASQLEEAAHLLSKRPGARGSGRRSRSSTTPSLKRSVDPESGHRTDLGSLDHRHRRRERAGEHDPEPRINARDAMPRGGRLTIGDGRGGSTRPTARRHRSRITPGPVSSRSRVSDTVKASRPRTSLIFEPFTTKPVGAGNRSRALPGARHGRGPWWLGHRLQRGLASHAIDIFLRL